MSFALDVIKKLRGHEVSAINKWKSTQLLAFFGIFLNKHFQRTWCIFDEIFLSPHQPHTSLFQIWSQFCSTLAWLQKVLWLKVRTVFSNSTNSESPKIGSASFC